MDRQVSVTSGPYSQSLDQPPSYSEVVQDTQLTAVHPEQRAGQVVQFQQISTSLSTVADGPPPYAEVVPHNTQQANVPSGHLSFQVYNPGCCQPTVDSSWYTTVQLHT